MKPRLVHIKAISLGDHIPVLNGTLVQVRDTPYYRFLTVRKTDGSRHTYKRRNNQMLNIHWR